MTKMVTIIRESRPGFIRAHCVSKEKAYREVNHPAPQSFRPVIVEVVHIRDRRIRHDPEDEHMITPRWLLEELVIDHTGKKKSRRYRWALQKKRASRAEAKAWMGLDDRMGHL